MSTTHNDETQATKPWSINRVLVPFLLGTAVGGVAGAVAGALLCHQTSALATAVLDLIDRRLNEAERERLRFDLMLQ
ncbi:MAG: hypothetical protein ACRDJW_17070 [Thermomicrobiales bacterium]